MSTLSGTVLITGANGFIGQHLIDQILKETKLNIKAIVRSQNSGDALKKSFGKELENGGRIELAFVNDMSKEGAYDEVVKGVDYIVHLASPLPDFQDPNFSSKKVAPQYLDPAIKGVDRMLEAANKSASVKKVVLTSSVVALIGRKQSQLDENDWNTTTYEMALNSEAHMEAYMASKALAERAAWDFMKKNSPSFTLTALNPTFIFGPTITPSKISGTNGLAWKSISTDNEAPFTVGAVDVRDVAKAHLQALVKKEATDGKRYLIHSETPSPSQLIDIAHRNFPAHKNLWAKPVTPVQPLPADAPVITYTKETQERSSKDLGIKFRSVEESIVDLLTSTLTIQASL